jgi:hypothetical protein
MRLFFISAIACAAQVVNPGFEQGEAGLTPAGWFVPRALTEAGFRAETTTSGCRSGAKCAVLTGVMNPPMGTFSNLMQTIDAAPFAGKRIRMRGAVRVDGSSTSAQMWLRLDGKDGSMGYLDNMGERPIRGIVWQYYDIEANVGADVGKVAFGLMGLGAGKVFFDDVSIEAIGEFKTEGPRALSPQGLTNIAAFAKLYGYVRHFHPTTAASLEWDAFVINGVRTVEGAQAARLPATLRKIFAGVAPTVQIGGEPAAAIKDEGSWVGVRHYGVGLSANSPYRSMYKSEPFPVAGPLPPYSVEIAPGLRVTVPLSLGPSQSVVSPEPAAKVNGDPDDRATRLAAVIVAWNVFQHFYPYFDIVKTDWPAELPKALRAAATDGSRTEFTATLQRLVAALRDGHGHASGASGSAGLYAGLRAAWVEGHLIVVQAPGDQARPGDRIVAIDGRSVEAASAELHARTPAATEGFLRSRSALGLLACRPGQSALPLEIEPFAAPSAKQTVNVPCGPHAAKRRDSYPEPRLEKIVELELGIWYVDMDRLTKEDWQANIDKWAAAKGVIFDMRGYPAEPGISMIAHSTKEEIRSAPMLVPSPARPDRTDFPFQSGGWPVQPAKPRLQSRPIFLIDGRAISYAETVMAMAENYKLGEIVGEPTAGTNGNVNPFTVPGGYRISWTGMRVTKHDGSPLHGVGILPTVSVSRTRKGVAEGKDEILLKALEIAKKQ